MRVAVHYLTQLKRALGKSAEEIDAPSGASLTDLLRLLADRHDAAFRAMVVDDAGQPRKSLLFFIGDEHADLARPLADGDIVTILAPMSGG